MKKLLLLMALAASCLAASASHSITASWHLSLAQQAESITFTAFGFPATSFQTASVSSTTPFSEEKDEFGNTRLKFEWKPAGALETTIAVTARTAVDYSKASEPVLQGEAGKFLRDTPLVKPTAEIALAAAQAAEGAASDGEKLVLLTNWVHSLVQYEEGYWQKTLDAKQVFEQRKGVCKDYSHLLMAALRSQGIPSRLAAGFVESNGKWGPHAWVEAAVNGFWVAADPTFNEVKWLGDSHVKFAHGLDHSSISEGVSGTVVPSVTRLPPEVSSSGKKPFPKAFELSLEAPLEAGSLAKAEVKAVVKSLSSEWLAIPITLSYPTQPADLAVSIPEEQKQLAFLSPRSVATTVWTASFPEMQEGFSYNFSFKAIAWELEDSKTTAGKAGAESPGIERVALNVASVDSTSEATVVTVSAGNKGSLALENAVVSVTLEGLAGGSRKQTVSLEPGEAKTLEFRFAKAPAGKTSGVAKIAWDGGRKTLERGFSLEVAEEAQPGESNYWMVGGAIAVGLIALLLKALKLF